MSGPFPEIPAFEEVLSSLTLDSPIDVDRWLCATIRFAPAQHPDGTVEPGSELQLWFQSGSGVTWSSLRRKLSDVLSSMSHITSDEVCDSVIALFALAAKSQKGGSTNLLNQILRMIVSADLSQYFAFLIPGKLTIKFEVAGFQVGPLDTIQLAYRSRKAGSDYADVHAGRLSNLPLSISRLSKVNVIPWETFIRTFFPSFTGNPQDARYVLVDRYIHAVAEAQFEKFFREFREAQLLPKALGASWLSVEFLLRLARSERVSIFLNIRGQQSGWVAPTTMGMKVELGGPHIGVPLVIDSLTKRFGSLSDSSVGPVIRTYCRFLAEAAEAYPDGRTADAFLYHVIALDLLLGEKGSSTASVTKRSALLAHQGLGVGYDQLLKKCDRIYDARSQYVHAGKIPDTELLPVVEEVTREIVFVLFRLKVATANADATFRDAWVRRVDVLIAKLAANDPVSDEEFQRVGVACGDEFRYLELVRELNPGSIKEYSRDHS